MSRSVVGRVRTSFECAAIFCLLSGARDAGAAERAALRVASKTFTESVILGELVTQLERAVGVNAEHRIGLGGTRLVWDALLAGSVDVYPEYTGTLTDEILGGMPSVPGTSVAPEERSRAAKAWLEQALAARGIGMTLPLGFNNTYAIGVTSDRAREMGISRISELRALPALRFGFSNEFISRHDGWPALRERYALPQTSVQGLDHDLAYRALVSGAIDATDLYTTDAEIRRYALRPLVDDRELFGRYDAVLLYRLDIGARFGEDSVRALMRLQGRIDAEQMTTMNARAKLDRVSESVVAATFLRESFGVTPGDTRASATRVMLNRIGEHLALVGISLLAAIAIGVPLGIFSARRRKLGQAVLGVVGVVQTIPSLALLVFMIPLFGIGGVPAVAALFLYSLLPIVRNTHAGLESVPAATRESAAALGLPRGAILRLVELPLASPLIMAGIKSAAVINVGTATLGALVGAGGLGQPIFTGIRLDNLSLILQGAVPASLLALGVQGLFEFVERWVVPRGLRPRSRV